MLVVERGINVSSGIVTFLSRKEFTFTALYLELSRYVQFVVKQDESSLHSSLSQLHISSRGSSPHSSTLACLRARPKPPCCSGYKFIFFCHSLKRWERQAWKYQARDSHEKQINGPEGPPEGTVSRKPKIFSSFTQRDEEADRNIPSIYLLFVDQDEPLTLLTTQVKPTRGFSFASGTQAAPEGTQTPEGGGGGYLLIRG